MYNWEFRVWDLVNKKMLYMPEEKERVFTNFSDGSDIASFATGYFSKDYVKLLYTGIKYNNKKVYVGDRVEYNSSLEQGKGIIIWDDLHMQFAIRWYECSNNTQIVGSLSPLYHFQCQSEMRIIGHIFSDD